ncbi:MAG: MBL fold metallo-hydrolase [Candidatus Aminicenantes bacterium]|nr:MBL fold metallo-hydrolase [Candidatus Aminicenantes bacterium]
MKIRNDYYWIIIVTVFLGFLCSVLLVSSEGLGVTRLNMDEPIPLGLGNPDVREIKENVLAVTGLYHSPEEGYYVNAGIIFTKHSVVFIDAGMTIASAEFLWKTAQERRNDSKNLYLILTHHHADHVFGMRIFKEKRVKIVAHHMIREWLANDKGRYKRFLVMRSGWTPEKGDEILGDVVLSMPDQLIEKDTVLQLDGEEIQVLYTPGHVIDELSVYHPKSKTLFAGDTIYEGTRLTTRFGGPQEWKLWISQLERLKQLDIEMIVPGHGKLCPKKEIDRNINYLRSLL